MATKNGVPFRYIAVPADKYGVKCPYFMKPTSITVHNTDNEMPAINEINYMHSNNNETSYHFAIDDVEIIQGLPLDRNGWHSGDGGGGTGNRTSIGVEICLNYDRKRKTTRLLEPLASRYAKAEENAIKAIAQICVENNIVASVSTIRSHKERSGKNCPSKMYNEGRWDAFRQKVINEYKRLVGQPIVAGAKVEKPAPAPKPVVDASATKIIRKYGELGSFKVTDPEGIIVRDKPSISGNKLAVYEKNELLEKYHTVHLGNGYVWIQYTRGGGKGEAYMPIREFSIVNGKEEYGKPWGILGGVKNIVAPKAVAKPAPAPAPKPKKQYVQLAKTVSSWNVYRIGDKPVNGNQCATLNPRVNGGLEYEILGWSQKNTVAIIKTHDFGKVQIFVADKDAKLVWK